MTLTRRDPPRRVTPELMAFYKRRAHQLRAEACRQRGLVLWAWLKNLLRLT